MFKIEGQVLKRFSSDQPVSEVRIPDGVEVIAASAFHYARVGHVIIPDSVQEIKREAFWKCRGLAHVTFSGQLRRIGYRAFAECPLLREIELPASATELEGGIFDGCTGLERVRIRGQLSAIPTAMFQSCTSLVEVNIPETVTKIKTLAFSNCESLSQLTLPPDLQEIGANAFAWCQKLLAIEIPKTVQFIGNYAFLGTAWLKQQSGDFLTAGNGILIRCTSREEEITIPQGVTAIAGWAMQNCCNAERVHLPDTLVSVEADAFHSVLKLREIHMPSVKKVGKRAFHRCEKLETVTFSERIESVGHNAFSGTPWLEQYPGKFLILGGHVLLKYRGTTKHVEIPPNVTRIEKYAFSKAENLQSVTMHDSITEIDGDPFASCPILGLLIWYVSGQYRVALPFATRSAIEPAMQLFHLKTEQEFVEFFRKIEDPIAQDAFSVFLIRKYDSPEGWAHYRKNKEFCLRMLAGFGDAANLQFFLDRREVDAGLLEKLLEHAALQKQLETQTLLLHYKNDVIGYPDTDSMFQL